MNLKSDMISVLVWRNGGECNYPGVQVPRFIRLADPSKVVHGRPIARANLC